MKIRLVSLITALILFNILSYSQYLKNKSLPFSYVNIHLERNVTDGDIEAVMEIKADDDGLTKLSVVSPNGKTILEFESKDKAIMGIRQFRFESPEPKNENSLKSAYPEGKYIFKGETTSGKKLSGECLLSHKFPAPGKVIQPLSGATDLATSNMKVSWGAVKEVSSFIVYIENDDFNFTVSLPGSKTTMIVPEGYLEPQKKYMLGLGAQSQNGNISFVEVSFKTGNN
jgi:hypothetical protein